MSSESDDRLLEALREAQRASEHRLADEIRRAIDTVTGSVLSAEREAAQIAVAAQQDTLEILRHERDVRETAVAQQERLAARVRTLQTQLLDTRELLQASMAAEVAARRELESLWGSTSWRFTRPLREIGLLVKYVSRRIRALVGSTPEPVTEGARDQPPEGGTDRRETGLMGPRAELSPSSARVLDELQQAMDETRRG